MKKRKEKEELFNALTNKVLTELDPNYNGGNPLVNQRLQDEAELSNISVADELNKRIMNKRNKYLGMHTIPITQGPTQANGKPGKWCTRLPNGKQIHMIKKEDVEDRVIAYYVEEEVKRLKPKLTLNTIFNAYFKHRMETVSEGTYVKDLRHYNTYIKDYLFADKELPDITVNEVKEWAKTVIAKYNMKPKYYDNVVGTLNTMFTYLADECNLSAHRLTNIDYRSIKANLCDNNITVEEKEATKKSMIEGRNLYRDEIIKFKSYIKNIKEKEVKVIALGLLLILELGLRVGELCSLKYSDFSFQARNLHLCRRMIETVVVEETSDGNFKSHNDGFKVVSKLKHRKESRDISLTTEAIHILNEIRELNTELGYPSEDNDYVFWRKNAETKYKTELCTIRVFDNRIRNICEECNFKHIYSCHDLRRTYATLLHYLGYLDEQIQNLMGHNDVRTTRSYIGKLYPDDDVRNDILNNLSSTTKKIC